MNTILTTRVIIPHTCVPINQLTNLLRLPIKNTNVGIKRISDKVLNKTKYVSAKICGPNNMIGRESGMKITLIHNIIATRINHPRIGDFSSISPLDKPIPP